MVRRNRRVNATKLSEQRPITDFFAKRDGPANARKSPPRLRGTPAPHCGSSPPPTSRRLTYDVNPVQLPRELDSCSLDLTALASLERAIAAEQNVDTTLKSRVIDIDKISTPVVDTDEQSPPSKRCRTPALAPVSTTRKSGLGITPPSRRSKRKAKCLYDIDEDYTSPAVRTLTYAELSPTTSLRRSKRRASRRFVKYEDDTEDDDEVIVIS